MSTLTLSSKPLTDDRRAVLHRRIRWIVAGTITYNVIEAAIALAAGTVASTLKDKLADAQRRRWGRK